MSPACPSDLALESYLRRPNTSACAGHVTVCMDCVARLSRMREEGERFVAQVFPATLDRVLDKQPRRFQFHARWLWALAVPAAAAVALTVLPKGPPEGYTGTKGDFLTVYVHRAAGAEPVKDHADVPADGELRFEVHPPRGCWVSIVSVDRAGQVSKLFPARADSANVGQAGELPGGATLDGQRGPERVFGICSPNELSFSTVESAVKASVAPGEAAVRHAGLIRGLPPEVLQDTVLLEKTR